MFDLLHENTEKVFGNKTEVLVQKVSEFYLNGKSSIPDSQEDIEFQADVQDMFVRSVIEQSTTLALKVFEEGNPFVVEEWGCGIGIPSLALRQIWKNNIQLSIPIRAYDIDEKSIQQGKYLADLLGLDVEYIRGSALELEYRKRCFVMAEMPRYFEGELVSKVIGYGYCLALIPYPGREEHDRINPMIEPEERLQNYRQQLEKNNYSVKIENLGLELGTEFLVAKKNG